MPISTQDLLKKGQPQRINTKNILKMGTPVPVKEDNGFSFGEMASNILPSTGNLISSTAEGLIHPIQTGKAIGGLALGAVQKLIPGKQKSEENVDAMVNMIKERYGSWDKFTNTLEKDPAGVASDLSLILGPAGAGLKAAGTATKITKLAQAGKKLSKYGTRIDPIMGIGAATGGTIKGAVKLAGKATPSVFSITAGVPSEALSRYSNALADSMVENDTVGRLVKDINSKTEAIQSRVRDNRASTYQTLKQLGQKVDISELENSVMSELRDGGLDITLARDEKGIMRTLYPGPLTEELITPIKKALDEIRDTAARPKISAKEFTNLENRVGLHLDKISAISPEQAGLVKGTIGNKLRELRPALIKQLEKGEDVARNISRVGEEIGKPGRVYGGANIFSPVKAEAGIRRIFSDVRSELRSAVNEFEKFEVIGKDTGKSLKNPMVLDRAAAIILQRKTPQVLRALSAGGGSIAALFSSMAVGIPPVLGGALALGTGLLATSPYAASRISRGMRQGINPLRGSRVGESLLKAAKGARPSVRSAELIRER